MCWSLQRRGRCLICRKAPAWGHAVCRRTAQLLARRPDLTILPLRGNVDTRVRKVMDGEYDAIVLAHAGLDASWIAGTYQLKYFRWM